MTRKQAPVAAPPPAAPPGPAQWAGPQPQGHWPAHPVQAGVPYQAQGHGPAVMMPGHGGPAVQGNVRLTPPDDPPPPRKKRGEDGFRTSRLVVALSGLASVAISVLAGGIGRPVAGMAWAGYMIGSAVLWLVLWFAFELYARHRWQVKHRRRRTLRSRGKEAAGAGLSWAGQLRGDDGDGDPRGEYEDYEDPEAGDADARFSAGPGSGPWHQDRGGPTGPHPARVPQRPAPPASQPQPRPAPPSPRADAPVLHMPVAAAGPVPPEWQALADSVAMFVPGDDTDLLAWLSGEIRGAGALAGSYVTVFESCVTNVGLTTAAIGALHDTGDHTAALADLIAQTRRNFTQYYEGYRAWAADGGVSPHSGHFITGQDPD